MKAVKNLEKLRRKAWLAGIAAYEATVDAATNKIDQIYVDGNAFVNDLVNKGESLETELQFKLGGRAMFEEKITALRKKLGMNNESRDQQIDKLSVKVDNLIEVVAKLAQQQAVQKSAQKGPSEKTEVATKPVTKKPAAKKTAAAKAPAAKKAEIKPAATSAKKPVAKTTTKPATVAKKTVATKTASKPAAAKPKTTSSTAKPTPDAKSDTKPNT